MTVYQNLSLYFFLKVLMFQMSVQDTERGSPKRSRKRQADFDSSLEIDSKLSRNSLENSSNIEPCHSTTKESVSTELHKNYFYTLPERAAKRIFDFLGLSSLDSTNLCLIEPQLVRYRSSALSEYYATINDQYTNNRSAGFLSPDHCRTPMLIKTEDSLYTNVEILRSHRRLSFCD